ncbi:hypothetical protein ACLOJK_039302 [Asimina triloba]
MEAGEREKERGESGGAEAGWRLERGRMHAAGEAGERLAWRGIVNRERDLTRGRDCVRQRYQMPLMAFPQLPSRLPHRHCSLKKESRWREEIARRYRSGAVQFPSLASDDPASFTPPTPCRRSLDSF